MESGAAGSRLPNIGWIVTRDSAPPPGVIRFPDAPPHALRLVIVRFLTATGLIFLVAAIVFLGRDGYRDVDGDLTALDALYYSTVAVTTTGYGDIVPVSQGARLVTVVVLTPIRVAFLILVVSTTVEVLAATTRYLLRVQRWRSVMRDHYVICGYGTKGRSAAATLVSKGIDPEKVVVVEWDATTAGEATADGFTVVVGDCTRESVLSRANVANAKGIVVAVNLDSTAVLTTLTIRILNPTARLVAAVKEAENFKILRRGGASVVVTSDEATGRLLGLAIDNPHQAALIEDLLLIGEGVDLVETDVTDDMVGGPVPDKAVAVIRGGRIITTDVVLRPGDRLLSMEENGQAEADE
ncbi:MAG TPA: NAD-binding protein [Acidimicrobiia bacterium]|nr:NAD-binding protein [Acidimicrobiia bacterium]